MKTEAEIRVTLPQTRQHLGFLEADEARKHPLLEGGALGETWSCRHVDFRFVAIK